MQIRQGLMPSCKSPWKKGKSCSEKSPSLIWLATREVLITWIWASRPELTAQKSINLCFHWRSASELLTKEKDIHLSEVASWRWSWKTHLLDFVELSWLATSHPPQHLLRTHWILSDMRIGWNNWENLRIRRVTQRRKKWLNKWCCPGKTKMQ